MQGLPCFSAEFSRSPPYHIILPGRIFWIVRHFLFPSRPHGWASWSSTPYACWFLWYRYTFSGLPSNSCLISFLTFSFWWNQQIKLFVTKINQIQLIICLYWMSFWICEILWIGLNIFHLFRSLCEFICT